MAMRPRGSGTAAPRRGGARSAVVRPVYEDFRPVSEWLQDDESHILNIYLPGFLKEQIRVSTEGQSTIRVGGERLVAGNKWNRFKEDYQVPENGEMNSVRAKFQGGILIITVPKVTADDALPPKTQGIVDIQKQPTPQKGQEKVPSEASQTTDEKGTKPHNSSSYSTIKQGLDGDKKGQDKAFPAVDTSQPTDNKSLEPEKTPGDPKKEHNQEVDQRGRSFTPLERNIASHDIVKQESGESKEKHIASERTDDVRKTTVDKVGKETIGSKELPDVETAKKTKFEQDRARGIPEKNGGHKESYGASPKAKYKKAVKGLTELNEERQFLVNMGAAMLVIVALTAYVTYSFVSAKDKN